MGFFDKIKDLAKPVTDVLDPVATVLGGVGIGATVSALSGGMGTSKAGPKFSDLGVTDPTTGKPVFLSAGEISTVMGATGGVAPTKFQAATEGFFSGAKQGQQFVGNLQAIQSNAAAIRKQTVEANIAEQTEAATIITRNNAITQAGIQAKVQTQKLTTDSEVLDAVYSGDPIKITDLLSSPAHRLSTQEQKPLIDSVLGPLSQSGALNSQQQAAYTQFGIASQIFKAGPVQERYNQAAQGAVSTFPVRQLIAESGQSADEVLAGMEIVQVPPNPATMEVGGTALRASNGKTIKLDDAAKEELKPIRDFFGAREEAKNPTQTYALPRPGATTPVSESAPPLTAALPAAELSPTQVAPSTTAAALPPEAQSAAPTSAAPQTVNPNAVSATGIPIETANPKLSQLNTKTTPAGVPLQSAITKRVQQLIAETPPGAMTLREMYNQASKEVLRKAPLTAKASEAVSTTANLAEDKRNMAREIRGAIALAKDAELELGPTSMDIASRFWREEVQGNIFSDVNKSVGQTLSRFNSLTGRYTLQVAASSGMGTKMFDTPEERKRLEQQGPNISATAEENLLVATRLDGEAQKLEDEATLVRYLDTIGNPINDIQAFVTQYNSENKTLIFDEKTNTYIPNTNRIDPTEWVRNKLGIDSDQAAQETLQTPTSLPKSPVPSEAPAAGSESSAPFQPAKKQNTSAFLQTTPQQGRGANYNQTPATVQDLKAMADAVSNNPKSIRQFQASGSVPFKLGDFKATTDLVARVVSAESSGNINAVSPIKRNASGKIISGGVEGVMQVTNATFKQMAKENETPEVPLTDRRDPLQSIVAGTQHLNQMLKAFDGNVDLALAAQNAGIGTVQDIMKAHGFTTARTTIDMIEPYLPKTQPTADWVRKITSRGRVAPEGEVKEKGTGFFDGLDFNELNPLRGAEKAEAEEFNPGSNGASPQPTMREANPELFNPDGSVNIEVNQRKDSPGLTSENTVAVPDLDSSPRNDVPPVSDLQAALSKSIDERKGSLFPETTRQIQALRSSIVGRFLGGIKDSEGFDIAQNYANAVTMGLYDEGMNLLNSTFGFDGKLVQNEIRASLKSLRQENPKAALVSDLLGSVAGGWGALKMFKALRGVSAVPQAIGPSIVAPTVRQTAKIAAAETSARFAGEGETPGERIRGAAIGAVAGGALGGAGGLIAKTPVVGAPAIAGAGIGAIGGAITGDSGEDALTGALKGAGIGASAAGVVRLSPLIQKAITRAVTMLNEDYSFRTYGELVQKLLGGKTTAEIAADLTPDQALMAAQMQHMTITEKQAMLDAYKTVLKNNPEIPVRAIDFLEGDATKNLTKALVQMNKSPELSALVGQAMKARNEGMNARIAQTLGDENISEEAAREVTTLVNRARPEARKEAIAVTQSMYSAAESATPSFNSPKIKEILSTPAMKKAVAAAREDIETPLPKKGEEGTSNLITDLSDKMFNRVRAGQPIDDLIQTEAKQKLPANSFKVLTEARRKLGQQIEDASGNLKRELGDLQRELTAEMERLSPGFAEANAEYSTILSQVDSLKPKHIAAIGKLAEGNVEQAYAKVMALPDKDLQTVVDTIKGTKAFQKDPETFVKFGKGFLAKKLADARGSRSIASKLISPAEEKSLKILMGEEAYAAQKAIVDAESRISRTNVIGGSQTAPLGEASKAIDKYSGATTEPASTAADIVAGTPRWMIVKTIQKVLGTFERKGDPVKLRKLADTLVLKAEDGLEAMEKVVKASKLTAEEKEMLMPYLGGIQDQAKAMRAGIVTSATAPEAPERME